MELFLKKTAANKVSIIPQAPEVRQGQRSGLFKISSFFTLFVIIRPAAKQVFKSQMHWLIEKAKGVTFFPKRPLPPQIFLFFSWWHKRREQVEKRKFCLIAKNLFSTFLTREQNFSDIFQSNALRPEMTFSKFSTGTKKDASIWKQWSFIELLQLPFYHLFMIEGREKTDGRQILWRLTSRFRPSSRLINKGEKKVLLSSDPQKHHWSVPTCWKVIALFCAGYFSDDMGVILAAYI